MKRSEEKSLMQAFKGLMKELALWRETAESFTVHWSSNGWFSHNSFATIKVTMRDATVLDRKLKELGLDTDDSS